jgi:lysyl-tRNA synthetase class 2
MRIETTLGLITLIGICSSFAPVQPRRAKLFVLRDSGEQVISPFDDANQSTGSSSATTATAEGPFELTWENVEKVLDEMRPFLIQDGGNVAIKEIDGPVVKLELQVRCNHDNW